LATSLDEEIARDFILFGQPDVTIVVVDATRLERNLNLVLQVLEITERVVVCLNLIDEAKRHGIEVDHRRLARDLGIPVVPTIARQRQGMEELLEATSDVASGNFNFRPHRISSVPEGLKPAIDKLSNEIEKLYPGLPNTEWVAMRLLDGDERIAEALYKGELGFLSRGTHPETAEEPTLLNAKAAT
jgi:ferrous iron transport protein B